MEPVALASAATVTTVLIWLIAVVLAAALFAYLAGGAFARSRDPQQLIARLIPLQLPVVRNLADPHQTWLLSATLGTRQFRMLQRHRVRALMLYIHSIAHNAKVLIHLGAIFQRSSDPAIVLRARQLSSRALRMRIFAYMAIVRLCWDLLFPGAQLSVDAILQRYEQLWASFEANGIVQKQVTA